MTDVSQRLRLPLLADERWWGGAVADGHLMPFGGRPHGRNLGNSAGVSQDPRAGNNQSAPLLLSDRGRFIWSELPFAFDVTPADITVTGHGLIHGRAGDRLRDAFRTAAAAFFPASGRTPAPPMLTAPQYNTWIDMPRRPTQDGVLAYAQEILDAGLPPGVLMIDDRWSPDYGTWTFDPVAFPDPGAMISLLHSLGFSVMLWVVPYIDPSSATFGMLAAAGLLVREPGGRPAIRKWWNGDGGVLDATNPRAVAWLQGMLDLLVSSHGVDGFKFDGGDFYAYTPDDLVDGAADPAGQCEAWARLGLRYPFNEYRACWKMGGQPLAQRLHDKPPVWGAGGLASLIPEGIAQGLIGHPFICPDMIGGGELDRITAGVDQELFVRYAQCAALFPMMQFSLLPSRVLDADAFDAVKAAVILHQKLVPEIITLARHAARTGEPILRPMAYHFAGLADVADQFMLGEDLLAAPVLEPHASFRPVLLPPGTWRDARGHCHQGGTRIKVPVTIAAVPLFRRVDPGRPRRPPTGRTRQSHHGISLLPER